MSSNIDKVPNRLDSSTDFIPIFKFDSQNMNTEHTMYINKNRIYAFSHFKFNNEDCLLIKVDKCIKPTEFMICKEENPTAFNELFKGLPERLPKVKQ